MRDISYLIICGLLFAPLAVSATAQPSSESCAYYQSLEKELQCGPEAYLKKWAYPMCKKYLKLEPKLSAEVQAWFPAVRFCLQNSLALAQSQSQVNCENLDQVAIDSHVDCYVETGYCDLSDEDKSHLSGIMGSTIFSSALWIETSLRITWACF